VLSAYKPRNVRCKAQGPIGPAFPVTEVRRPPAVQPYTRLTQYHDLQLQTSEPNPYPMNP